MSIHYDENTHKSPKTNGNGDRQPDLTPAGNGSDPAGSDPRSVSQNWNETHARPGGGKPAKAANGKRKKGQYRPPASVEIPVVEPWPEAVNGAALLNWLVAELKSFVVFPKWAAETLALWILHTFAFRLREVTTYIGIESPEKECGKSTLLTLLSRFVDRAAVSSNISPSAFFRVIEEWEPTLLIDEGDTNLRGKDDLMGILNAGYTKSTAFVWRMCFDGAEEAEGQGGGGGTSGGRVARYSCWCPKAIAAIGHLNATLASRCILIGMQRKTDEEQCKRLKYLDATELKRKCARFVADHAEAIRKAEPKLPAGLTNRAADVWEPLLALADLAGGEWPELARQAASGLTERAQQHSPIGSLLLDIYIAFVVRGADRVFSRELVAELSARGERPWLAMLKGGALTERWLAAQLEPYGVRPRTIRIGEQVAKGYALDNFGPVFKRYIPKVEFQALKAEVAEQARLEKEAEAERAKTEAEAKAKTEAEARAKAEAAAQAQARTEAAAEAAAQAQAAAELEQQPEAAPEGEPQAAPEPWGAGEGI